MAEQPDLMKNLAQHLEKVCALPASDDEFVDWRICPVCGGHGQPQGDGSGWDGTSYHTPACDFCGGRGEVPACTNWRDSCHGDNEIEACTCRRSRR